MGNKINVFSFFDELLFGINLSGGITSISESELTFGGWSCTLFTTKLRFIIPVWVEVFTIIDVVSDLVFQESYSMTCYDMNFD